jgi:DNA-repair protein complementing XP-A cells
MTLKEWERNQLLKQLQRTKQGPFEPGISILGKEGRKCRECASMEIDFLWEEVFGVAVCEACKRKMPERYSLLTKTEAKDDYLLTDRMCPSPPLFVILCNLCDTNIYIQPNLKIPTSSRTSPNPTPINPTGMT